MQIDGGSGGPSFDKYSSALEEQTKLKDELQSLKAGLVVLQQLLTQTLTTTGIVAGVCVSSITNPHFQNIVSEIQKTRGKTQEIVRKL